MPRTPHTRRARRDTGFNLIEVMVSLGLLSVLGLVIAGITIQALRTSTFVTDRAETQAHFSDALLRVSSLVAHADAVATATPTELVLTSTAPTGECVLSRFRIDNGDTLLSARAACSPTPVWTTDDTVVSDLDAPSTPFTYFNTHGDAFTDTTNPSAVHRVKVSLQSGTQTLTTSATLREVDDITLVD